jgi:hypothetical protein
MPRTCCLLDEHSHDLTHQPTHSHEPTPGVFVERLLLPVSTLHRILLTHQPSPDPCSTCLRFSVLLI